MYPEREVWKMTPYKIVTLFKVHKSFNKDQFKEEPEQLSGDPIDIALGGL